MWITFTKIKFSIFSLVLFSQTTLFRLLKIKNRVYHPHTKLLNEIWAHFSNDNQV